MAGKLRSHQEIRLLAIRDDKRTFSGGMFRYSVAGAMVSELLIQQRIVANDDESQIVAVIDDSLIGDSNRQRVAAAGKQAGFTRLQLKRVSFEHAKIYDG